jgi:lysyl-tRNA synthetase class 2
MKFSIDEKIFEKFTGLNIGVVLVKNTDNSGTSQEVENLIKERSEQIRSNFNTETLSQNPKIEVWRKAYSAFGGEPKKNRSSVESLYRLVLNGNDLRHINKLVDIYNFISLKHMLPVGGEDLDKIKGGIALTFAQANETPVLLLGEKEERPPKEGEIIYKDEISAVCRRWNWREADRTKLTEETKNCVLVTEGLLPVTRKEVESATKELKELVEKFCGGKIGFFVLDKNAPKIEF